MISPQPMTLAAWTRHWLYDSGGANIALFLRINQGLPDRAVWIARLLSSIGSYLGAPFVLLAMIASPLLRPEMGRRSGTSLALRFGVGLLCALGAGALAKSAFALPRPSVALGDHLVRAIGSVDSLYSFPSGHSIYVALLAGTLWPVIQWPGRLVLLAFAAGVGWSRIALGAHFPADVLGGYALGLGCAALVWAVSQRWLHQRVRCDDGRV